ncbi:50S ribosomal protein L11 methyltransferase [Kribbella sp. NPDC058693]|uniref:50S ribosomal protein L11 methyltransferase n=1 Tax=Kribbella sp. NPDC058693 TaxID=3346602 RepID=UPI003646177F
MKPRAGTLSRAYNIEPAAILIDKHRSLTYPHQTRFGSAALEITDGVFCPTLTRVSPLLRDAIKYVEGGTVLDAFTGSGAFAIDAALNGAARVLGFDFDPLAVACARDNVLRNSVETIVDIELGTARDVLRRCGSFDLVIANPPLLPGSPRGYLRSAIFDPALRTTVDLVKRLPGLLEPDGRCYMATSDVLDRNGIDLKRLCADSGLTCTIQTEDEREHETYRIHLIKLDPNLLRRRRSRRPVVNRQRSFLEAVDLLSPARRHRVR